MLKEMGGEESEDCVVSHVDMTEGKEQKQNRDSKVKVHLACVMMARILIQYRL